MNRITSVDNYLERGCMRCKLGGTKDCKVHAWQPELQALRQIVQQTNLTEEIKWSIPVYTFQGKNVCSISAFKNYSALSFFKGALLTNPKGLLLKHGPNSQAVRYFEYTSASQIEQNKELILDTIFEAISNEEAGKTVPFKKNPEPIPEELTEAFQQDQLFQQAFNALTPGRQRGYILYFSQAKKRETRQNRIQSKKESILQGKGMQDR